MLEALSNLLQPLFEMVGDLLNTPEAQFILRFGALYIIAIWLASVWWAFRDAGSRSRHLIIPYLVAAAVILSTPVFFVLVVILYRITRAPELVVLGDERRLARAALGAEVARSLRCPTCRRRVDGDWILCPFCRTRLSRVCPNCHGLVGLDWSLCAWCGRDFAAPMQPERVLEDPAREARLR